MIDFFRKYVSVVVLILMGLLLLDVTTTTQEDMYIMEQTEILSSIDGDEFDEDEDSEFLLNSPSEGLQCRCDFCPVTSLGEEQNENLCSAALRLGQVRRYAPRKNLADSHNYIITKNIRDGADYGSDRLFLSHNSIIYQLKSN